MGKSAQKIISNSTILLSTQIIGRAIRIFLVIFSARLLGDENYGKFTFALSFTTLFLIFSDMGLHQLMVREISRNQKEVTSYLSNGLIIKILLSIFYLTFIVVSVQFMHKPFEVILTVVLLALFQIVVSFNMLFKSVFQAFQQMKFEAFATILQNILTTIVGIIILHLSQNHQLLAGVYLFTSIVSLVYCLHIISKKFSPIRFEFDIVKIKVLFRESIPFGLLFFFAMIYVYMDSVMLSLMKNDDVVGWYNAAYRLIFTLMFIPIGIMKAVFPVLSKAFRESLKEFIQVFEKTFKVLFYIGFSVAVLISLMSEKIVIFLYGQQYHPAADALRILVWSTAIVFLTTVMTHMTRSSDQQRFTARIVGLGALINTILNLLLISRYSYIGAAYATLITEGFVFVSHFIFIWKRWVCPPFLKFAPKILITNLTMAAIILLLKQNHLIIIGVAAILINILMITLTRYFSNREIKEVKEFLRLSQIPINAR